MRNLFKVLFITILLTGATGIVHADITIHLDIETSSGSIYNKDITVTPCDSDNAGTMATTAYCAIIQAFPINEYQWTWFGTDAFLDSIKTTINNDNGNGIYWGWFANLNLGQTALNKYTLNSGDTILLTYNINPLKISVDNQTPTVGNNIIATVTEFGYDESWNPGWNPATGGKLIVGSNSFDLDANGTYSLQIIDTTPIIVKGQKTGYIDSSLMTINPILSPRQGGGGGGILALQLSQMVAPKPIFKPVFDISKALDFLATQQKENGSFGEDMYTDWSALALASSPDHREIKKKLLQYFSENKLAGELLTDYERRAMALMALGLNPYNINGENYIGKIVAGFDGKQFGIADQDNDDIFALIVLQNAGFKTDDKMILDNVSFVLSKQKENGSWDNSVDMTGAALQALGFLYTNETVKKSLEKAKEFLKQNQKDDGGWNNISSTAWAIGGLLAVGETITTWEKNGSNPFDFLAASQEADGGMKNDIFTNKIWETAYATVAMSNKPWNQIMQKFEKPKILVANVSTKIEKKQEKTKLKKVITIRNVPAVTATVINAPIEKTAIERKPRILKRFFNAIFNFF